MSLSVSELFAATKAQAGSAGVCDVEDWMDRANAIAPEILSRIHAKGTVDVWCLPCAHGCVVLPSDLGTPLQAWRGGTSMGFRGEFWLGRLAGDMPSDLGQEIPWQELVDDGRYVYTQSYPVNATVNDVYEVVARSRSDVGKTVEIRYSDTSGREVIYLAKVTGDRLASPPSDIGIGQVIRVSKPRMAGAVELWLRNLRNGNRALVAVYAAHDEKPAYRLAHLTGYSGGGGLTIRGKRKWLPLRSETDLVPFGGVIPWRAALAAEAASANKAFDQFNALIGVAVGLLDAELMGLRSPGTAEVVDHIMPATLRNRHPLRRKYA